MDFDGEESGFGGALPPAVVSLTPFTPIVLASPRRLSSCFTQPSKPAVRAKPQLAWVSLQGRLAGAEEATEVETIDPNGVLGAKEAAAWELFTPIQRVLIVAVAAAAAANSEKNKRISQLQKSVEVRDQVLLGIQQKLDNICEQLNTSKVQPEAVLPSDVCMVKSSECGCKPCVTCNLPPNGCMFITPTKGSNTNDCFKHTTSISNEAEPEERRMSDLSDWAPSVASSVDFQLDSLVFEHEINGLRKECEEKDVTIQKLSTYIQSSEALGSKRIVELEDLIRRKNMIINKLRKDIIVLEQNVMNLTRLRRRSFPAAESSNAQQWLPTLMDNVLYDLDCTTGPSSSDSDNSPNSRRQVLSLKIKETSVLASEEASKGGLNSGQAWMDQNQKTHAARSRKQNSTNQTPESVPASRTRRTMCASGDSRPKRQLHPPRSKEVSLHKRWA